MSDGGRRLIGRTVARRQPLQRVLLKLSGEAFAEPDTGGGVDPGIVGTIADEVAALRTEHGTDIGIVVGGGNMIRGAAFAERGMDRSTADHMGMLGTVINALALQDAIERAGVQTRVQTAVSMQDFAEPYIRRRAIRHLEKGRVVIFAAGLGSPYFTTDTTAAQRALEIDADAILKGTKVDGVYDKDPKVHDDAVRFDEIDFLAVLNQGLKVMDATAISLCMDHKLPIIVFDMLTPGNIARVVQGEDVGTIVHGA